MCSVMTRIPSILLGGGEFLSSLFSRNEKVRKISCQKMFLYFDHERRFEKKKIWKGRNPEKTCKIQKNLEPRIFNK